MLPYTGLTAPNHKSPFSFMIRCFLFSLAVKASVGWVTSLCQCRWLFQCLQRCSCSLFCLDFWKKQTNKQTGHYTLLNSLRGSYLCIFCTTLHDWKAFFRSFPLFFIGWACWKCRWFQAELADEIGRHSSEQTENDTYALSAGGEGEWKFERRK